MYILYIHVHDIVIIQVHHWESALNVVFQSYVIMKISIKKQVIIIIIIIIIISSSSQVHSAT